MVALTKKRKKTKIRKSWGDRIFDIVNYGVVGIFALVCVMPFIYVAAYSITPYHEYMANPLKLIPDNPTFEYYKYLLHFPLMGSAYRSTLIITIGGTALNIFMLCITAYPLTKKNLKGRNAYMIMVMITMFFGGGMIPSYLLIRNLHLIDTYWALILPGALGSYNLIMMRNFISSLPAELEESAYIDGANPIIVLSRIILPLSKPALATFTLFNAVGHWNSYMGAVLYIRSRDKWPLMVLVKDMVVGGATDLIESTEMDIERIEPYTLQMALIIATILPILLVYPFLQKYFMKGMLIGSVKG